MNNFNLNNLREGQYFEANNGVILQLIKYDSYTEIFTMYSSVLNEDFYYHITNLSDSKQNKNNGKLQIVWWYRENFLYENPHPLDIKKRFPTLQDKIKFI